MKKHVILLVAFLVCISISSSYAAVYKWVDEKGKVWITDYPNPKTQKKDHAEPEQQAKPQPVPEITPAAKAENSEPSKSGDGIKSKPFAMPPIPSNFKKGMPDDQMAMTMMSALIMFSGMMMFFWIAAYIYSSVCLYFIAKKTDVPNPWLAFVPLANLWVMVTAAGKDWWWILLMLVPIVNIGVTIYIWMCITENVGKDKWLGLLIIVPIVQFVWMGILAFSKQELYSSDTAIGQV